mgnify:CR=1 FL=1
MIRTQKHSTSLSFLREVFCAHYLGLFLLTFAFINTSCKDEPSTPPWNNEAQSASEQTTVTDRAPQPNKSEVENTTEVRFVAYNIRNYLTMRRGKELRPKPETEIDDLIENLARTTPDVLGLCEIGNQADLDDLQDRLKKAGHDLPHQYLTSGEDPVRRLALLSRFPITEHPSPLRSYKIGNEEFKVSRGFLDATINTPAGDIRLLGAHLKSKRPVKHYDQAVIRRHEALILRKRATEILGAQNPPMLLVYGDMNDTKRSQTIRTIKGPYHGKNSLKPLELAAEDGTKWTQYWAAEDIYSRFDFAFVSDQLLPKIVQKKSYVLDTPRGDTASDHRALVIIIK